MVGLDDRVDGVRAHDEGGGGEGVVNLSGLGRWAKDEELCLGGDMGCVGELGGDLGQVHQGLEGIQVGGDQGYVISSTNAGNVDAIKGDTEAGRLGGVDGKVVGELVVIAGADPTLLDSAPVGDGTEEDFVVFYDSCPVAEPGGDVGEEVTRGAGMEGSIDDMFFQDHIEGRFGIQEKDK